MNNTYGTHVLLEACRMNGNIQRIINVSTDEVYGESSLGAEKGGSPILLSYFSSFLSCFHTVDMLPYAAHLGLFNSQNSL